MILLAKNLPNNHIKPFSPLRRVLWFNLNLTDSRVCQGKVESGFPEKTNENKKELESVWFNLNLTDSSGL
jgi:hypothetical protein